MTTLELIRQRVKGLRDFFQGRLGPYGWQTQVKRRTGLHNVPLWLRKPETLRCFPHVWMERLEALAVSLGYKLGGLEEPFERNILPRRKPKRECLNASNSSLPSLVLGNEKLDIAAQDEHNTRVHAPSVTDSLEITT